MMSYTMQLVARVDRVSGGPLCDQRWIPLSNILVSKRQDDYTYKLRIHGYEAQEDRGTPKRVSAHHLVWCGWNTPKEIVRKNTLTQID